MAIGYDIFWHLSQASPLRIATVPTRGKVEQMLHALEWVLPGEYFTRDLTTGEIVSGVDSSAPNSAWEGPNVSHTQETSVDEIAGRAYELYLQRGCEHGRDVEDWLKAEKELAGTSRVASAGTSFPQASRRTAN